MVNTWILHESEAFICKALKGVEIDSLFNEKRSDFCGRWFPNPVMPGLRRIGTPDSDSPVVVTGNYHLTVRRVEKALTSQNARSDHIPFFNKGFDICTKFGVLKIKNHTAA